MLIPWLRSLLSFRNAAHKDYLIIGLGNPGRIYVKTRHNIGFRAVRYFAQKNGTTLEAKAAVLGEWGKKKIPGVNLYVLLPKTYMNCSGESVKAALTLLKLEASEIIVVVDDTALPLGELRLKKQGSHGGHNGLRNIADVLGTSDYNRLRLGIGSPQKEKLSDYVLSNFSSQEEEELPSLFEKTTDILNCWIKEGIDKAMTKANTKGVI